MAEKQYEFEELYLTEKDSQVEALCEVLGTTYDKKWYPAYNRVKKNVALPLQGHVLIAKEPGEINEKYNGYGEETIYVFPDNYELKPNPIGNAEQIFNRAVDHIKRAKKIILATDFDNEGASLGMNVIKAAGAVDRIDRMIPMGSTHPEELKKAIEGHEQIPYENMANAGFARAFIDYAEGMSLSRALRYYLGGGKVSIPFGGVLTPLIYIVVERYLSNKAHNVSYYWIVKGFIKYKETLIPVTLKKRVEVEEKGVKKSILEERFDSEVQVQEALAYLKDRELEIGKLTRTQKASTPPLLYELAGLQGDMIRKANKKPIETMDIGQKLYDFPVSLTAYPRTDIPYLKSSEYADVPQILTKLKDFGIIKKDIIENILANKIPKRITTFNDKEVIAHGAIVPTLKGDLKKWLVQLNKAERDYFDLVATRYTANFMEDYKYILIKGETKEDNGYVFFFEEEVPLSAGWKEIYEKGLSTKIEEYKRLIPDSLKVGDNVSLIDIGFTKTPTKPKPLFDMNSLLKAMENVASLFPDNKEIKEFLGGSGIGTNATRASIIEKAMTSQKGQEPFLIEQSDKKIVPSQKAIDLIKILPVQLVSPIKRAFLSKKLKAVSRGELSVNEVINEYREDVLKNIDIIKSVFKEKGALALNTAKTDALAVGPCPICGKDVVEKEKTYMCSGAIFEKTDSGFNNKGCKYTIYKSGLERFGKAKITAKEASNMLNKGKETVSLKAQKTNKAYSATIIPDNQYGVKVVFEQK